MKNRNVLCAILALSFLMLSYFTINPIIANMIEYYNEYSVSQVQMILTIIPLSSIITLLSSGILVNYISKKRLSLIGVLLILFGAFIALLLNFNLYFMYLSSFVIGLGVGLLTTLTSTLISDYFTDPLEKGKIMGYQSALVSIGGAFFSFLSGVLASYNWRFAYISFFIAIFIFLIAILMLPNDEVKKKKKVKTIITKNIMMMALINFIFFIGLGAYNTNISIYFEGMGFGSVESGLSSSLYTAIGILGEFVLGFIIKAFKEHTLNFASILGFIGLLILALTNNLYLAYMASLFLGFAFAVRNPAGITFCANIADKNSVTLSIGLYSLGSSLAIFLSPYVLSLFPIDNVFLGASFFVFVAIILQGFFNPLRRCDVS